MDEIIKHMYRQNVIPRSEQLALLLETSGRNTSYLSDKMYKDSLDEFIGSSSADVLGITARDIANVVSSTNNVFALKKPLTYALPDVQFNR